MLRAISLVVYACVAALGTAILARPALFFVRGLGLLRPALPWTVPLGALQFVLAVAIASLTVVLTVRASLGAKPRLPLHGALLGLLGLAWFARHSAGEPSPPPDPAPQLLQAMTVAADALDASYRGSYPAKVPFAPARSPYMFRGRPLGIEPLFLQQDWPQVATLAAPGTLYVAISADRKSAWITAQALTAVQPLLSGKPAVLELHGGTHSLPGRDRLVPLYPGMRSVTEKQP
jgi:hypothetical protein